MDEFRDYSGKEALPIIRLSDDGTITCDGTAVATLAPVVGMNARAQQKRFIRFLKHFSADISPALFRDR